MKLTTGSSWGRHKSVTLQKYNVMLQSLKRAYYAFYLVFDWVVQPLVRRQLKDSEQLARFELVCDCYSVLYHEIMGSQTVEKKVGNNSAYRWTELAEAIRSSFQKEVPIGFLAEPHIRNTMVFGRIAGYKPANQRISYIEGVLGKDLAAKLLREDYIGLPNIVNLRLQTSANRAHHVCHLSCYRKSIGVDFWNNDIVIEWGGGYGNMARIIQRMNRQITYIIIDLPELLALQYIYLYSVLGDTKVNLVTSGQDIAIGKVNLVSSVNALSGSIRLSCSGFLSTWALNESPLQVQEAVIAQRFFEAKRLLLAYSADDGNKLVKAQQLGIREEPVPFVKRSLYGFR